MAQLLCPFVDDTVAEATAIAENLRRNGFPFPIQPVMPDTTTDKTLAFMLAAKPRVAIVDYFMTARPRVKTEQLAVQLIRKGIPTVLVTKDRGIVDEGPRVIQRISIPVYHKRSLISSGSNSIGAFIESLGITGEPVQAPDTESFARLSTLQDRRLLGTLTRDEGAELELLMARVRLAEREEVGRLEAAGLQNDTDFSKLLETLQGVRKNIDDELKRHKK
jgi:hypothetical protein